MSLTTLKATDTLHRRPYVADSAFHAAAPFHFIAFALCTSPLAFRALGCHPDVAVSQLVGSAQNCTLLFSLDVVVISAIKAEHRFTSRAASERLSM